MVKTEIPRHRYWQKDLQKTLDWKISWFLVRNWRVWWEALQCFAALSVAPREGSLLATYTYTTYTDLNHLVKWNYKNPWTSTQKRLHTDSENKSQPNKFIKESSKTYTQKQSGKPFTNTLRIASSARLITPLLRSILMKLNSQESPDQDSPNLGVVTP